MTNFESFDVHKSHGAVAGSAFASQNVQKTSVRDPFWKFRCSKMAGRCGPKHICKSKCAKNLSAGPILEVPMLKNGMPLWPETHLQVKMRKKPQCGTDFGSSEVQKWHAAMARSTFVCQIAQNIIIADQFWKFRCSKMARRCGAKHICK